MSSIESVQIKQRPPRLIVLLTPQIFQFSKISFLNFAIFLNERKQESAAQSSPSLCRAGNIFALNNVLSKIDEATLTVFKKFKRSHFVTSSKFSHFNFEKRMPFRLLRPVYGEVHDFFLFSFLNHNSRAAGLEFQLRLEPFDLSSKMDTI